MRIQAKFAFVDEAVCTLAFLRERDGNEARATALLLAAAALDGGDLCVASYDVMPEFRTPEGGVSRSQSIVERTTPE